jgi:hypothetical protein
MQSQPDTIARLWTAARAMFARLRAAVGEAAALAARASLSVREQREIRAAPTPAAAAPARPPAVTLVALPAPRVRVLAHAAPPPAPRVPAPSLRLWPRPGATGPRVRDLGRPLLARDAWRDRARLALARHLANVRLMRRAPQLQLARRIEALERVIARPLAAARRLARKLRALPKLALKLACAPAPRTRLYADAEIPLAGDAACSAARAFYPNTS